jgi:hypothetical protein
MGDAPALRREGSGSEGYVSVNVPSSQAAFANVKLQDVLLFSRLRLMVGFLPRLACAYASCTGAAV